MHVRISPYLLQCGGYRRKEAPGGGPGLDGIKGGGEPMPMSGSWVNRNPCRNGNTHNIQHSLNPKFKMQDEGTILTNSRLENQMCVIRGQHGGSDAHTNSSSTRQLYLLVGVQCSVSLISVKLLPC